MTERPSLLVVAHGFSHERDRIHPAREHVRRLRATNAFEDVRAGFVNDDPAVEDQARSFTGGPLVVVPLFVSDGYFVGKIPKLVEAVRPADMTVEYARPVGTHEQLTDVIMRRAFAAVDGDADGVGVALFGHGSEQGTENRETITEHARRVRTRGPFTAVRSYFVEEEPTGERVPDEFAATQVVAVPVFVARGTHVREDIPEDVGFTGSCGTVDGTTVTYVAPVGADPLVAGVVFERAIESLDGSAGDPLAESTALHKRRQQQ